jgi:di/tricarboxylate transporter
MAGMGLPTPFDLAPGTAFVFALVVVTVVLFVTERLPPDVTALAVVVTLVVARPLTGIDLQGALSGFSNPATLTIVAMFILSRGVQRTGIVRRLGVAVAEFTRGSESRLLAAVVGLTGPIAGVVNNTPVVAVLIPMVTDLANDAGISPSRLLIPLSYASMLGGTLTLLGTATNLVASDLSAQLIGRPFSMFEFTALGAVVFVVGAAYLLTVGRWLVPARVDPGDRTEGYRVREYLARVLVTSRSPLVGKPVEALGEDASRDLDVDVLDVVRGGEHFVAADTDRTVEARDVLTVRANPETLQRFVSMLELRMLPRAEVTDEQLDTEGHPALVEVIVAPRSSLVGETVRAARLRERYDATVLAVRKAGGALVHEGIGDTELDAGDALLLSTTDETVAYLADVDDFVVTGELLDEVRDRFQSDGLSPTTVPALAIVAGVVVLGALGVVPVVIAALGGVVAMVATGCLSTSEAYDAVDWHVVFLLAGVLPLGLALQETGGATLLATAVADATASLPPVAVLGAFYLLTGVLANLVTPVATVALLMPVAVDTAVRVGGDPFAFVLGVTFAASTAFMTPVGYQTNLMVYGPGGYRFTDYVRVGAPLQLLLAVVTTLGIAVMWGV